jgi:hypothetical protein
VLKAHIKRIHAIAMAAKKDRDEGMSPCDHQFCENDFNDIANAVNEAMSIIE